MQLTLEQLTKPRQKKPTKVLTPEVSDGSFVYVLDPTGLQRDEAEELWQQIKDAESQAGFRRFLVAFCLCDESNRPLFDSTDLSTFKATLEKIDGSLPLPVLARLFDVAMQNMGMGKSDVEELEGNLEAAD